MNFGKTKRSISPIGATGPHRICRAEPHTEVGGEWGSHRAQSTLDLLNDVIFKGATVQGIYGRRMFETWLQMSALLRDGKLNLEPLFKERLRLGDYAQAFKMLEQGAAGKVLLIPNGAE